MSWISDTYEKLKALWRRFEQWERLVLLREKEWRFPIYGTLEEFEQRFKLLVFQIPRDEFFRFYGWRRDHKSFGFCDSHELALKEPRPPINSFIGLIYYWHSPVYHFHGTLDRKDSELYLYGHYRTTRFWVNWYLGLMNFYYLLCAGWLIVSVTALVLGLPIGGETEQFLGVIVAPLFAAAGFTIACIITAQLFENLARPNRIEAYRLLAEICGSPSVPASNHSE